MKVGGHSTTKVNQRMLKQFFKYVWWSGVALLIGAFLVPALGEWSKFAPLATLNLYFLLAASLRKSARVAYAKEREAYSKKLDANETRSQALLHSNEDYILYLRPFLFHTIATFPGEKKNHGPSPDPDFHGPEITWAIESTGFLSAKLVDLTKSGLPVVALAPNTSQAETARGLQRKSELDDYVVPNRTDWLDWIVAHMRRCSMIVCVPSISSGSLLELQNIIETGCLDKTTFICPGNVETFHKEDYELAILESLKPELREGGYIALSHRIRHGLSYMQEDAFERAWLPEWTKFERACLKHQEALKALREYDGEKEWRSLREQLPNIPWPEFSSDGSVFRLSSTRDKTLTLSEENRLDWFLELPPSEVLKMWQNAL